MVSLNKFKAFLKSRAGNVATITAVAALPMVGVVGSAIDFSSARTAENLLQAAADSAALAAARDIDKTDARREFEGQRTFQSNLRGWRNGVHGHAVIEAEDDGATVTATARFPTVFMGLFGIEHLKVRAEAVARTGQITPPVEMAVIIDMTNSMGMISMASAQARNAVEHMIETTFEQAANPGDVVATIVPMADRINVGMHNQGWGGAASQPTLNGLVPRITVAAGDPPPPGWAGCFEPRDETINGLTQSLDDTAPNLQRFTYSVAGMGGLGAQGVGSEPVCGDPLVGPTADEDDLDGVIGRLHQNGTGRFDIALAWGWRLVSPDWRGQWRGAPAGYPADYGRKRKVVALITDGKSTAFDFEAGGPGVLSGGADWNTVRPSGFARIIDLCERMKDEGVEVHIVLMNSYARAEEAFEECASDGAFYDIDTYTEFDVALGRIGGAAETLRLVR